MTGEQLYALYAEGHARRDCSVDLWEELPEDEREVWRWMAGELALTEQHLEPKG